MAIDLFAPLKVVSWASAHANCPMHYKINNRDEMVIIFGNGQHEFELSLETGALHSLLRLGTEAMAKMEVYDNLVPDDHIFHGDRQLIAELAALNEQLSRYVVRYLDADGGRATPVSVADERVFAEALHAMAARLRQRADLHAAAATGFLVRPNGDQ